jgi:hypothetical protein
VVAAVCPPPPHLPTPFPQFPCAPLQPFFEALHRAVRVGGLICTQAESLWLHMDVIQSLAGMCKQVRHVTGSSKAKVDPWDGR